MSRCIHRDSSINNYSVGEEIAPMPSNEMERALLIAKMIMKVCGFSKVQTAAICGYMSVESHFIPTAINEVEKKNNSGYTANGGYGAGLMQWTGSSFKKKVLEDAGLVGPIEKLSAEQQINLLNSMSKQSQKKYFDELRKCSNIENASAVICIWGAGIGRYDYWGIRLPNENDARNALKNYGVQTWIDKYAYAKQVLSKL